MDSNCGSMNLLFKFCNSQLLNEFLLNSLVVLSLLYVGETWLIFMPWCMDWNQLMSQTSGMRQTRHSWELLTNFSNLTSTSVFVSLQYVKWLRKYSPRASGRLSEHSVYTVGLYEYIWIPLKLSNCKFSFIST